MKKNLILRRAFPLGILLAATVLLSCTLDGEKRAPSTLVSAESPTLLPENIDTAQTWLKIEKEKYLIHLYEGDELLRSYPIVLGPNPVDDKRMEGDGCTPEGIFKIQSKYPHKSWSRFFWIDYPNDESRRKFNARKASGDIPADARIGGEIGIHGVPVGRNAWVDDGKNWTLGCISLKTEHILELYPLVPAGANVEIVR